MSQEQSRRADRLVELVGSIRTWSRGGKQKPHKFLCLLAVLRLVEKGLVRENRFPYGETLKNEFLDVGRQLLGPSVKLDLEYPFYHLHTSELWHLHVRPESKGAFERYRRSTRPRLRFTEARIRETIEYAYLDDDLFATLQDRVGRQAIKRALTDLISGTRQPETGTRSRLSLFEHEAQALEAIGSALDALSIGACVPNYVIHDRATNQYYECDLLVITPAGAYVVELKHWTGTIQVASRSWMINHAQHRPDPHVANDFKCKILRGLYDRRFPTYPRVWFESVVVLTNPDAQIEGASSPKTEKHNPTFASIDRFISYLRYRLRTSGRKLTDARIEAVAHEFEKLRVPDRPSGWNFPGYEVVDTLTRRRERVELVARPTDSRQRGLRRFRVFCPPPDASPEEKERFRRRAWNTLETVRKAGQHPNLLAVWDVPNEDGLLVEGSNWSEEGTLADVIRQASPGGLGLACSKAILRGILRGLAAVHKQGVIHRALKPANILVVGSTPKLMNFDLSYHLEEDHITVLPDVSELKADPYIAPELLQGQDVHEASDLFSAGVIFYEMVVGSPPFRASTALDSTGGRLSGEALSALEEVGLTPEQSGLIRRIVCADVSRRPTSAEEVLAAFETTPMRGLLAEEPNRELQAGERFSVYEIEELVGSGAEAHVYRARKFNRAEHVALKVFHQDISAERIAREETAARTVRSPYVVRSETTGKWFDGRFFLEMEFLDGTPMRVEVDNRERPPLERFASIARCLLQAVGHLHGCEGGPLLHNDIKPENVILRDSQATLIDLGTACTPCTSTYTGTQGYVAPDLCDGMDLEFCESGDLFALGVTLFEWCCGHRPYEHPRVGQEPRDSRELRSDLPAPLHVWLERAVQLERFDRFASVAEMTEALEHAVAPPSEEEAAETDVAVGEGGGAPPSLPVVEFRPGQLYGNPFVAYLNSLHNATPCNEHTLAESQALSPHFGHIHVPMKVTDYILDVLTQESVRHVVLTGHAGDGKSTIGLELYKRLRGIPLQQPLAEPLAPREELRLPSGGKLVLVKDMSEFPEDDRRKLLSEACRGGDTRYLIISNTGTLLNTFRACIGTPSAWSEVESRLLEALDSRDPSEQVLGDGLFVIVNLAQADNVYVAGELLKRLVAADRWEPCEQRDCRSSCPIYWNVRLIREDLSTVTERVLLAYRRLFEYGDRLTARQMSAHLAYAITSGLDYDTIVEVCASPIPPPITDFLFSNRFFGDRGVVLDPRALQLPAVRILRRSEFGFKPMAALERQLWMKAGPADLPSVPGQLRDVFAALRERGRQRAAASGAESPEGGRLQVRRLLYFFSSPTESPTAPSQISRDALVSSFLNSVMLPQYVRWQHAQQGPSPLATDEYRRRVLHVLQEQFTGVRIPEGTRFDHVFITLSRREADARQSAQVVLCKLDEQRLRFLIERAASAIGPAHCTPLMILMRQDQVVARLALDLPFLDYVMMRHTGEIGQRLHVSYVDRLERFKASLMAHEPCSQDQNMMLVRLRTNHQFAAQTFALSGDTLEVFDA